MSKPAKKTVQHYDYHEIIHYIEAKYSVRTGDYYGCHGSKGVPWTGPPTKDGRSPYANFWHWMISVNDHVTNGSYIYFPENLPWGDVEDDPKCYDRRSCTSTPKFVMEIMALIEKEFGKEIYFEKIWVNW